MIGKILLKQLVTIRYDTVKYRQMVKFGSAPKFLWNLVEITKTEENLEFFHILIDFRD